VPRPGYPLLPEEGNASILDAEPIHKS